MSNLTERSALISVFNKDGIEKIARKLVDFKIKIISTGGTEKYLNSRGIKTEKVENLTNTLDKYNLLLGKNKMSVEYTYSVKEKQTGITNLLQDLKDSGFKLKDLKTEQSTLEKIFVNLVRENNEI